MPGLRLGTYRDRITFDRSSGRRKTRPAPRWLLRRPCESSKPQTVNRPSMSISHSSTVVSGSTGARGSPDASGNRRRRNAVTTDSTYTASQHPVACGASCPPSCSSSRNQSRASRARAPAGIGVLVGVLPKPESQLRAIQGLHRAAEQGFPVDRFPRGPFGIGVGHTSPPSSARWGNSRPSTLSVTDHGMAGSLWSAALSATSPPEPVCTAPRRLAVRPYIPLSGTGESCRESWI